MKVSNTTIYTLKIFKCLTLKIKVYKCFCKLLNDLKSIPKVNKVIFCFIKLDKLSALHTNTLKLDLFRDHPVQRCHYKLQYRSHYTDCIVFPHIAIVTAPMLLPIPC